MSIIEKDPRFRNIEIKTGVLVLSAIAGIIAVIILIGMERDLFTKKYRISFISESGAGFVKGMPVKLSGFKIGRVRSMELAGDARVEIVAEINRKYEQWIREGSKARLVKEGFIGDAFVEMTSGDPQKRKLADGDTVPYEKTGGIEELVKEAKPMLKEIKEIIGYANSPEGDIKVILGNIRGLTGEMQRSGKTITETVKEMSAAVSDARALTHRLNERSGPIMDDAGRVMERLDSITLKAGEAVRTLPETTEKMEKILDNVEGLTGMLFSERKRIRRLLIEAEGAARDGGEIARGLKGSWPVRLVVPERAAPELVPLDGNLFERKKDEKSAE